MTPYELLVLVNQDEEDSAVKYFNTMADDTKDAKEQALELYPNGLVLRYIDKREILHAN